MQLVANDNGCKPAGHAQSRRLWARAALDTAKANAELVKLFPGFPRVPWRYSKLSNSKVLLMK